MITKLSMNRNNSCSLISHKESSVSSKRLFMYWLTALSYFYSTNGYTIGIEILLGLFKISKTIKLYLFKCSMITKSMKFLHSFHLFTVIGFISHINYFFETKGTCTSYNTSNVIFLTNIMQEKESFWKLFLHLNFLL